MIFSIFLSAVSNAKEIAGGVSVTFFSAGHYFAESACDKMKAYRWLWRHATISLLHAELLSVAYESVTASLTPFQHRD